MKNGPKDDWFDRVYGISTQVFEDSDVASSVAATEKTYREHLKPIGSLDTKFERSVFGESQEPFWCDPWKDARFRAAREVA